MKNWRSMLGLATGTTLPKNGAEASLSELGESQSESNPLTLKPSETTETETNGSENRMTTPLPKDKESTTDKGFLENDYIGNNCLENASGEDGEGSLSSLSFYEDFPTLYFAVRKGRYANNTVFLSWDSARKHIVDYPDVEYIATPTLEQAHRYTNNFGEFDDDSHDDDNSSKQEAEAHRPLPAETLERLPSAAALSENEQNIAQSRANTNYTTRKLILEYYERYDPGYKDKGKKPLTIPKFLKQRNVFESKFKVFAKHWQRSGLLMMRNEEKPLEEAVQKYDGWVRDRKLEKRGIEPGNGRIEQNICGKDDEKSRKRKRPVLSGNNSNHETHDEDEELSDTKKKNKKRNAPNKKRNPKAPPQKATTKKANAKKEQVASNLGLSPIHPSVLQHATRALHTNGNTSEDEEDDNDNDEQWNANYEKLKAFHAKHGHCKVPMRYNRDLCYFVRYTRRRMRVERKGARALTLREEKLLNDLDFDPIYKEIVTEFNKYLGVRIAKLFPVEETGADGLPITKELPFFGTVGRISSVSSRFLRIKYDDGDSEDFDMECLKKGLELYNKYKHKDTLHGISSSIPTTTAIGGGKRAAKNGENGNDRAGETCKRGRKSKGKGSTETKNNPNASTANASTTSLLNHETDTIDFEAINTIADQILGQLDNTVEADATREPRNVRAEATITPETNPARNGEEKRRDSDHSTISNIDLNESNSNNMNAKVDGDGHGDGNESDTSDEVEIVDVRVPYQPNASLFVFPKPDHVSSSGDIGNNLCEGNNLHSIFHERSFDF